MSFEKRGQGNLKFLRSFRVQREVTLSAIQTYLEALDCPRALTVLILFRNGEHEQLAKLEYDPLLYLTMQEIRDSYAATKFLSKYKGLTLDYDLEQVAYEKFDRFELLCKKTNQRFRCLSSDPLYNGQTVWLHNAVIRKVHGLLGVDFSSETDENSFDFEEFLELANWGPGATTLIKRKYASSANKFQLETGITRDLYSLFPIESIERFYPLWAQQLRESKFPTLLVGNKVVTVPKDATTNRVIAIEPGLNLWFQKAIGEMIRGRLRKGALDLRWQSRNQKLARLASIDASLATVDLSSASDSISTEVVRALVPPRWFQMMDLCRSHFGSQSRDSINRKWEKFSSMGNGFTFELESLIFYAIALSCTEYLGLPKSAVSVYGDDVIIPTECFELFSSMCDFYGFLVNTKKSHYRSDSFFRESCGAHFWRGVDVKPIYLKDSLKSVPAVYRLANAIRRQAHVRDANLGCDVVLKKAFDLLVHSVPKPLRFWIPEGFGDGGFIGNLDEAVPLRARLAKLPSGLFCRGYEGWVVTHVTEKAISLPFEGLGLLLAKLWSAEEDTNSSAQGSESINAALRDLVKSTRQEGNTSSVRDRTELRLSKRGFVDQWYDLGPWL